MYGLLLREAIQHRTEKYTKIRWHVLGHVCPVYTSDTSVYNFKGLRGVWCKSKPLLLLRDLTTHIQRKCALFSRFKVEVWYLLGLLEGIISKAFLVTVCGSLTPRQEAKSWCVILSIKWIALVFFSLIFTPNRFSNHSKLWENFWTEVLSVETDQNFSERLGYCRSVG